MTIPDTLPSSVLVSSALTFLPLVTRFIAWQSSALIRYDSDQRIEKAPAKTVTTPTPIWVARIEEENEYDDFDAPPRAAPPREAHSPIAWEDSPPAQTPAPEDDATSQVEEEVGPTRVSGGKEGARVSGGEEGTRRPTQETATTEEDEREEVQKPPPTIPPPAEGGRRRLAIESVNPFDELERTEWVEEDNERGHEEAQPRPNPLPATGRPQKKKREGRHVYKTKVIEASSTGRSNPLRFDEACEEARKGKLFKHEAWVIDDEGERASVVATMDSGAECLAMDTVVFEQLSSQLGLELESNKSGAGVALANNSHLHIAGLTLLRVRVGRSEVTVRCNVIDSGGAFELLLGKPWTSAIWAISFHAPDCIMYPVGAEEDWDVLWNMNPKVKQSHAEVPRNPYELARMLDERRIREARVGLEDADEGREEETVSKILLMRDPPSEVEFWSALLPDDPMLPWEERAELVRALLTERKDREVDAEEDEGEEATHRVDEARKVMFGVGPALSEEEVEAWRKAAGDDDTANVFLISDETA